MKISLLLACAFFLAAAVALTTHAKPPVAKRKPSSEMPQIDPAEMNACLDRLRLESWNSKNLKKAADPKQEISNWHKQVEPSLLPSGCETGSLDALKKALRTQIKKCEEQLIKRPADSAQISCRAYSRKEWCLDVNSKMLEIAEASADMPAFLTKIKPEFDWYKNTGRLDDSTDGKSKKGEVHFTAYYTPPALEASSERSEEFYFAIYKLPPDHVKFKADAPEFCGEDKITGRKNKICRKLPDGSLVPFYSRQEIVGGNVLEGKNLAIAYLKDEVAVAQMMVEGSGPLKIRQPDGTTQTVRLHYAGSNGHPNVFLSRMLVCLGVKIEDAAGASLVRKWIAARPGIGPKLLAFDPYYSFFEVGKGDFVGVDGLSVTGMHSFATDPKILPTGAAFLFQSARPGKNKAEECKQVSSVGLAQDVGGAIVGAHVDWYMGEGEEAEALGDDYNTGGSLFVALPKGAGKPIEGCEPIR